MKIAVSSDANAHRITLDAPPLHILDAAMLAELRDALKALANDRHALILDSGRQALLPVERGQALLPVERGQALLPVERYFSAGVSVQDHLGDRASGMLATFHDCFRALARLDLVTIALVRGPALGGGNELACACDFILASDRATFAQPEIQLGVFAPVASYQLSRQLAPRKGLEMLLTGDAISAGEAARFGLINAVFPHDEFDARADEWLARLYRHSASSLRFAKKAFRLAQADDFDARLASVERLYLDELMQTRDATEGLEAFLEKRKPDWLSSRLSS